MRPSYFCLICAASSLALACGGESPSPKTENDATEHSSTPPPKDWSPSSAPSAATAPPPGADTDANSGSEAKKGPSAASGDLVAPAADDPWMAPHQMPAGDVIKTMKAARAKVNACWAAAKKREGSVSGEVKVKFVITHEGSVRVWRNEDSSISDEKAVECVGEVIKSLQFPKQKSPGDAWGIFEINFGG